MPDYRLGKKAPKLDARTLQFEKYRITPPIPYPESWRVPDLSYPMFANDRLGDCTCAAAGHMAQVWSYAVGNELTPTDDEVIALYNTVNGGVDGGAFCIDVLNSWRKNSLQGVEPVAYAQLNLQAPDQIKAAVSLFGGVYIGLSLPLSAQSQIGSLWDVVTDPNASQPGSWGGHCVNIVGYDDASLTCVTWGALQAMTWAFWNQYCDEAYAIIPNYWQAEEPGTLAPPMFDIATLQADLAALGATSSSK